MDNEANLIFDRALESLKSSELNLDNGFYNASINRSYYAVFYATTALLSKKGISTKKHSSTIQQFGIEYVVKEKFDKEIAKILSALEEDREDADYDFHIIFPENEAVNDLKNAKIFVEECRKYL
ncbi:MAG: HEPN domain-containing protein [Methanobrevibacter sp.]|nr:HEPN domain-containing protein [Candidatus Methanovirga australis]